VVTSQLFQPHGKWRFFKNNLVAWWSKEKSLACCWYEKWLG